jgi:hypothetical protein
MWNVDSLVEGKSLCVELRAKQVGLQLSVGKYGQALYKTMTRTKGRLTGSCRIQGEAERRKRERDKRQLRLGVQVSGQ